MTLILQLKCIIFMIHPSIYKPCKIEILLDYITYYYTCNYTSFYTMFSKRTINDQFDHTRNVSNEAIKAVTDVMNAYIQTRATVLFAQMQSGKTNAFLLLAAEMLREGKVQKVVIFTGNRERELKAQLVDQIHPFMDTKYIKYLEKETTVLDGICPSEAIECIQQMKNAISIVWGTELIKHIHSIPTDNTLYIFEESHFAQTIGQTPDKFLKMIGIPMNGDSTILEAHGNYVCSVSATPFSELSDIGHLFQSKKIIRMMPGESYRGVKWLSDNHKIIEFENWKQSLTEALRERSSECNWAIIRVRGVKQIDVVKQISKDNGWDVKCYDQENSDIQNMKTLEMKPSRPTLVVLRELCRMGTVVHKDYLSFVMETSKSANTDSLLQSLLGRACGYHTNNSLTVYINKKLTSNGEIQRYLDFCDGCDMSVPQIAKNMLCVNLSSSSKKKEPIMPIRIPKQCISEHAVFDERRAVVQDVLNAMINNEFDQELNFNNNSIIQNVIQELEMSMTAEGVGKVLQHRLSYDTFKEVPNLILESFMTKLPPNLGSGCGVTGNQSILLYYVDKPTQEMETGSYYMCCYFDRNINNNESTKQNTIAYLPKTNGKEIFRCANENGSSTFGNGSFGLYLNPNTATNEDLMLNSIRECVVLSLREDGCLISSRQITSNAHQNFKWTGIFVSYEIYISMLHGKRIFNEIKNEFGVSLKMTKTRGRNISNMPDGCLYRLASISW